MKYNKIRTIGMLFIAILFSINTNVLAQRGSGNGNGNGNGQGSGRGNGTGYISENIPNLTTDQETKINGLRNSYSKEMQNYNNQLAEKRANGTSSEISAIEKNMQNSKEKHSQQVRNLLTTDQKVYFDNMNQGNGQGYGNGQGRGNGNGNRNGSGNGRGNGNGRN